MLHSRHMHNLNEMNKLEFGMALAQFFHGGLTFWLGLVEVVKNSMKARRFSCPIVGAVALALLFCGAEQARATSITIVDFEDLAQPLAVTPGTERVLMPAMGVDTRGFHYTPNPLNGHSFNDLHISNAKTDSSYNGSIVGITHNEGILTEKYGGSFSLQKFDFAGFLDDKEISFEVIGDRADTTTIMQTFYPDRLVDGIGGDPDFETFVLDSKWTNLVSVKWKHTGYGTIRSGLFALDNIVVNKYSVVPEPSSITLLGLGILCLLGRGWVARKR
jgi:PEP-CTERM motif